MASVWQLPSRSAPFVSFGYTEAQTETLIWERVRRPCIQLLLMHERYCCQKVSWPTSSLLYTFWLSHTAVIYIWGTGSWRFYIYIYIFLILINYSWPNAPTRFAHLYHVPYFESQKSILSRIWIRFRSTRTLKSLKYNFIHNRLPN